MNITLQLPLRSKKEFSYAQPDDPWIKRLIIRTIERLTGSRQLQRIYQECYAETPCPFDVWENALGKLDIDVDFELKQLDKVPKSGPVIFVANHPFGILDGAILLYLVAKVRRDYFLLINAVLANEPMLEGHLLPVDFSPTPTAKTTNLATRKETTHRLNQGEALAIFPSGAVATARKWRGPVEEFPWRRFISSRIHETECTVVPIYFHGQNSWLFQAVSKISINMRLGLLVHELMNKRHRKVKVAIGNPITYEEMKPHRNRQALIEYLHERTMSLKDN